MRPRTAVLLIAFVLALGIRVAITEKDAPDALYHLRRAEFLVRHFPKPLLFDPIINFPDGAIGIWPPLFDFVLAAPARIVGGAGASVALLERTAFWIPPLFGALAVIAAGLIGMAIHPRWGAAAALVVAIAPGHIEYTQFAHTDQHVAESLWMSLALAAFLWALRLESRRRIAIALEAATGLSLALGVLNWQGAIIWIVPFAGAFAIAALRAPDDALLRRALLVLGLPAVIVAIMTRVWLGGFDPPFTYVSFGWFQPAFLAAAVGGAMLAVALGSGLRRDARRASVALVIAALALVPLAAVATKLGPLVLEGVEHLASATKGTGVVGGGYIEDPKAWLTHIAEQKPLLAGGAWSIAWVSFAFFLAPVSIVAWIRAAIRRKAGLFHFTVALWAIVVLGLTLSTRRNVFYGATLAGVAGIDLAARASQYLRHRHLRIRERRKARLPLFAAVLIVLALPMIVAFPREVSAGYEAAPARLDAVRELGRLASPVVDPYDARMADPTARIPELARATSVMALWSQGHLITWYSGLPVVADNFGYGYFDSLRFLFAENEADALAVARKHRVRWIMVFDMLPLMNAYGEVSYGGAPWAIETPRGGWKPAPRYFRTMQARLYEFDGKAARAEGIDVEPLRHFRLAWSSSEMVERFGHRMPAFKIFEIVK